MGRVSTLTQWCLRSRLFLWSGCLFLLLTTVATFSAQIEAPGQLWTQEVNQGVVTTLVPRNFTSIVAELGTPLTGGLAILSLISGFYGSKEADGRILRELATANQDLSEIQRNLTKTQENLDVERLKTKLYVTFRSLFTSISQLNDQLGLADFTVRLYCRNASEQLEHFVDIRHHNRPPSNINWKPGMGCLGNAWTQNQVKTLNLIRTERIEALKSPQSWDTADPEMTQGLSHKDAEYLQKRPYKGIAAHPISSDGRVVGVLVIDMPQGFYSFLRTNPDLAQTVELHIELSRITVAELDRALSHVQ